MKREMIPPSVKVILITEVGSSQFECVEERSDRDYFVLTANDTLDIEDEEPRADYFLRSMDLVKRCWGHPLIQGDLVGKCLEGSEELKRFLEEHRKEILYASPAWSARMGLEYIAEGEKAAYKSTVKASLRTAMILSHMAEERLDPLKLDDEEKAVLIRARDGGVPMDERVEIYKRTIGAEVIERLLRMPDHPTVKGEFFALVEEVEKLS